MGKYLVFGTGIEFAHVKALAKDNEVLYYTEYTDAFPQFSEFASGLGFKNIKKTTTPYTDIDKVDKILTFDVYFSDLFEFLKDAGYDVFGGGVAGYLELDRELLKHTLNLVGIPSPKYKKVKLSQVKPPAIVKFSFFRGSIETFFVHNDHELESVLHKIYREFGEYSKNLNVIVEEPIDTSGFVEAGIDAFYDKGFIFPMLCGIEYKKGCYIGKVINDISELPKGFQDTILKLDMVLNKANYKGMISTEEFVNPSTGEHYFLDITVRGAYPLSLGYPYWITNYTDVILKGAKPKYKNKYVVAVPFCFEESRHQFINIEVPNDDRFQFEALMKVDGKLTIPKSKEPMSGIVCEAFSSLDFPSVYKTMSNLLDKVKGYSMTSELEKLPNTFKEFQKLWN